MASSSRTVGLSGPSSPAFGQRAGRSLWSRLHLDGLLIRLIIGVTVGLVALPIVFLLLAAFNVGDQDQRWPIQLGLDHLGAIPYYLDWLGNSFLIAVPSTLLAVLIGMVLAWVLYRTTIPAAGPLEQLILIPYYVPSIVGALAWSLLGAERTGMINQLFRWLTGTEGALVNAHSPLGIILVMSIYEGTLAFIMIGAAMKSMDPALEECSQMLGASRFTTARRITLPLLLPAILGSAIFIFAEGIASFSVPAILGLNAHFFVVSTGILSMVRSYPPNYGGAAMLGLSLFIFTALLVWFYNRKISGGSFVTVTGKAFRPRRIDLGRWTPALTALCLVYVLFAVVIPLAAISYASFLQGITTNLSKVVWTTSNYRDVLFSYGPARLAIQNSLLLGVLTATLGVVFMGLLVWIIYRSTIRGRGMLEYVAMFPHAIPRFVLALGLLWAWLTVPAGIYGTIWILLLAYLTVFMPMGVRAIAGVVLQVDKSLEESARVCGASWLQSLTTITAPLLWPGLVSTWALLFIVTLRETSTSILLVTGQNMVVGPSIFVFYEMGGMVVVSALALVLTGVIFVPLLLVKLLAGKTPVAE